jgi:AraC family transcriptional regulator of adaptative response / DNA-3-methyladenine glycosylase II
VQDDGVIALDPDHCYAAVQSRDTRFDGWFVTAVRTTGIYCRPSCPAITPRRRNVEFYPGAASAQQRGFRACKRCRPDAAPGSPEWNVRQDVVARAMRLIADGIVEREGVAGLARRLGYSERHLNRLMTEELGAGPLAVARAQRAHTARTLIETTDMSLTDIAFAAGFGSVRQFNETIREVFAAAPSELRAGSSTGRTNTLATAGTVVLRLPVRTPFAGSDVLRFLGVRSIPGLEHWDGEIYRRSLRLAGGHGVASLRAEEGSVNATVTLEEWSDLGTAVHRLRRLLDLDADPQAVDGALGSDPRLAALIARTPGLRSPATVDPFETSVRAVIGQQVSVTGAATVAGRIVEQVAPPLRIADGALTHVFPTPAELIDADATGWSMPTSRAATIQRLAEAVENDVVRLDEGADPDDLRSSLLSLAGIGPWTADYVLMRGLGHPDTFLAGDLGVRRAAERLGIGLGDQGRWSPWSSYAVHHLWAAEAAAVNGKEAS